MLGLRMIEKCVFERHEQNKLDDKDDSDISREGRAAHPGCETGSQR